MKLTTGVNFTKILCTALLTQIPKVQNMTDGLTVFFALMGIFACKSFELHVGEIGPWSQSYEINLI